MANIAGMDGYILASLLFDMSTRRPWPAAELLFSAVFVPEDSWVGGTIPWFPTADLGLCGTGLRAGAVGHRTGHAWAGLDHRSHCVSDRCRMGKLLMRESKAPTSLARRRWYA
jgi:hypothetical protein